MVENGANRGTVLLVEDEDLLRESLRLYLVKKGYAIDSVKTAAEALARCREAGIDLLVSDLHLAGLDGLQLAEAARKHNPHLQVIIVTGHGSKERILQALRQGVWDFVEKPFDFEILLITIEKALEKIRMEKELIRLSRTDGLTGLYNQRYFTLVLEKEIKRATRQKRPLSLILVDVDDFKKYNDLHGHLAGDDILTRLAACLRQACRKDVDLAFRYGGDEFVILLPEGSGKTAEHVAERLSRFVERDGLGVTLSVGVTELPPLQDLRGAVREADQAMYLAKQLGGNRRVTFEHAG
jgi:two-component system cell cycle response regulator